MDSAPRDRRSFIKSGLLAASGALVATTNPAKAATTEPETKPAADPTAVGLPMRKLGKTGLTLPILAMGGSAMVKRFIAGYGMELLPTAERVTMVRHAYDQGIRYFDAARIYDDCEEVMGRGLKGVRDQCYLATKVHATTPDGVRKSVETSLKALGVDRLDCVQIHSPAIELIGFDGAMKLHAELVKLRDQGLFKFIGLTTHVAFETVLRMISTGGFDQVLLAYGYFRKGMDTLLSSRSIELRDQCLAKAHELDMGIVAMKILGANVFSHNAKKLAPDHDAARLARLPAAAIRWVLQDQRVSILNIGVSAPSDIDQNLATLRGKPDWTDEDRALLAEFAAKAYALEPFQAMRTV